MRKRKRFLYTVEFTAKTSRMTVSGAMTIHARHWTRAREAVRLRLVRAGWQHVIPYRPHQMFLVGTSFDSTNLAF